MKSGLERMRPQFKVALPAHITPERFERTVLTSLNNDPDLLTADRRSFFNACSKAAQDGLLPDKREGALVIFKDRNGKKLVQWMPMVYGLIKLMRQSGEIEDVGARIVYAKEIEAKRFEYFVSDGREQLRHEPMLYGDRGEKVLVYAYARFKNGRVAYKPIHRDDVLKRKRASRAQGGPWASWEDEMWLKTAIRMLAKTMPLSAEVMGAIDRDEEPTTFDRLKHEAQSIADAAAQFSGQAPALEDHGDEAEIIDAEIVDEATTEATEAAGDDVLNQEAADDAESPLERGLRLLKTCADAFAVNDLHATIRDELPEDFHKTWDKACDDRKRELKPATMQGTFKRSAR